MDEIEYVWTYLHELFETSFYTYKNFSMMSKEDLRERLAKICAISSRIAPILGDNKAVWERAEKELQWLHPGCVKQRTVLRGYEEWSTSYDVAKNALISVEEPVVLKLMGDVSGKRILDIGCGTGRYTIKLAEFGADVVGIDSSAAMLGIGKGKIQDIDGRLTFMRGDLLHLPMADEGFDIAVCALTLCHVPELKPAIDELCRVVKERGMIIVSDFHPFCLVFGWRTGYRQDSTEYQIENHCHLFQEYLEAFRKDNVQLDVLQELTIDDVSGGMFHPDVFEVFRGMPLAFVIKAFKNTG